MRLLNPDFVRMQIQGGYFTAWILFELFSFGSCKSYISYSRIDEVKTQCSFVLSSAVDRNIDIDLYTIENDLSFSTAVWWQDGNDYPIIPNIDRGTRMDNLSEMDFNGPYAESPSNMASFWITDIKSDHKSKRLSAINGFMILAITTVLRRNWQELREARPFIMNNFESLLSIPFQGLYFESDRNGGENVLCLLGSTELPSRGATPDDPWKWAKASDFVNNNHIPVHKDDQILLILSYPKTFTLTSRMIRGEMKSLRHKSHLNYFDDVHITSMLSDMKKYQFGSRELIYKACYPYPYNDESIDGLTEVYKGEEFCKSFPEVGNSGTVSMTFKPSWKCNRTSAYCSQLGPFGIDDALRSRNGSFEGFEMLMQNVRCEHEPLPEDSSTIRVSAVFMAHNLIARNEVRYNRSSIRHIELINQTVAAEGIWNPSNGQLCMIACSGLAARKSKCDSRICLYIPQTFSITQRSLFVGSISSLDNSGAAFEPLFFQSSRQQTVNLNYFTDMHAHYTYTKIKEAGAILERNEPFSYQTLIKKTMLNYPKLEDMEPYSMSHYFLATELSFFSGAYPYPHGNSNAETELQLDIFTIGPLFRDYYFEQNVSADVEAHNSSSDISEKQLLVNISAQIKTTAKEYHNASLLFAEGLYDPEVGKMYLVGCRDVRASWEILLESMDLESGMDCLIEMIVMYPPVTSRWLVDPTVKITISSKRNDDDPLHFNTIYLQTHPIIYRKQREDILSTRSVEAVLRVLTLSFCISCILNQILYIKRHPGSIPCISLVMLGIQATGFIHPLITGAEALFKRTSPETLSVAGTYGNGIGQWIHLIDYMVKVLTLVAFLLILQLFQKVWKARTRLLSTTTSDARRVPSDKIVLFVTIVGHVICYVIVVNNQSSPKTDYFPTDIANPSRKWESALEKYLGVAQDVFLFPQVIGNLIWRCGNDRPLRKLFYVGITFVRLLPHAYDMTRAPVRNPYFPMDYEFADPQADFFSKFGDKIISFVAVILAGVVFIQQRWGTGKLMWAASIGQSLSLKSRYERLSSKAAETELACGDDALDLASSTGEC